MPVICSTLRSLELAAASASESVRVQESKESRIAGWTIYLSIPVSVETIACLQTFLAISNPVSSEMGLLEKSYRAVVSPGHPNELQPGWPLLHCSTSAVNRQWAKWELDPVLSLFFGASLSWSSALRSGWIWRLTTFSWSWTSTRRETCFFGV